jgi:hypothetical protein
MRAGTAGPESVGFAFRKSGRRTNQHDIPCLSMLDANLFSEYHVRTRSLQLRTLFDDANSTYALELGTISHAVVLAAVIWYTFNLLSQDLILLF